MPSTPQVYREIELGELLPEVQKYKSAGWRFVQLCATTIEGGVEILYTFAKGSGSEVENLLLKSGNEEVMGTKLSKKVRDSKLLSR